MPPRSPDDVLSVDVESVEVLSAVEEQDIIGDNGFKGENFSTNVDYKLNKTDVLTNAISINHRRSIDDSRNLFLEKNGTGTQTDNSSRPRDNESKGINFDYTSALKRTFEPRKHELGLELRFNHSHDEDATSVYRESVTSDGTPSGAQIERQTEAVDAVTKSLTAQLDYTRPVGKSKLETGYKGNARWLDRDFVMMVTLIGSVIFVRRAHRRLLFQT